MLAEKNAYIDSAYEQLQIISQDRQKRLEYEARLKATLDYNQGILEATERGIAQEKVNTERERKRADEAEARVKEAEARVKEANTRIKELEQMLKK